VKGIYMTKKCDILLTLSEEDPYPPVAIKFALEDKDYQVTALGSSLGIETLKRRTLMW